MNSLIKILFVCSVSGFVSCKQTNKSFNDKTIIELNSVDSLFIIAQQPIKLSKSQIKLIAEHWNSATPKGPCIFFHQYEMTIYLHDKQKRQFRISGGSIKENSDYCYDLGDEKFVENLLGVQ